MEKIRVHIDKCDDNYCASTDDNRIGGGVLVTRHTYEEVIKALREALTFHVEGCVADGDDMPEWLVDGEYDFDIIESTMVQKLWFDEDRIYITNNKGETLYQSLQFYPRLLMATDAERQDYEFEPFGIHWEQIDEDVSYESFYYEDTK